MINLPPIYIILTYIIIILAVVIGSAIYRAGYKFGYYRQEYGTVPDKSKPKTDGTPESDKKKEKDTEEIWDKSL